jgi:hypothetical protein
LPQATVIMPCAISIAKRVLVVPLLLYCDDEEFNAKINLMKDGSLMDWLTMRIDKIKTEKTVMIVMEQ